ncbi:MAG: T9SS type A sorting domain-containing protein [Bacteroidales bacterium]|nr:T9SS type A sorting domain-containing protein [Bacteroidales bacterium]
MKTTIRNVICIIAFTTLPAICQFAIVHAQEYVKADFVVSDSTPDNYTSSQLSVSNTGDMVVVWETVGKGGIWFKTISSFGTILSDQKPIKVPFYYGGTRVAHADSGNFMIMFGGYVGYWEVYGQAYDPEGNEIGDTLTVGLNTSEMINMHYSSLSADSNNQFRAFLPGSDSLIVETISGKGEFVGNTIVLKHNMINVSNLTGIMTRSGEYIMVWRVGGSCGDIHGLRYNAEGVPIGETFQISQKEENFFILDMSLACDTTGNFAVVWKVAKDSTTNMYSQLFNAAGVSIGTNTLITGGYFNIFDKISVDMDLDGKFVIAWRDDRSNDTSFIYIQQMDNKGEKVGDNYRATSINNNFVPESLSWPVQSTPDVHILRDTIYLAWVNYNDNIFYRSKIYANIQKWMPDVTGLVHRINKHVETTIYPNLSAGIFSLIMDHEYSGRLELEVFNATGALVKREIRSWSGPEATIDLSEVPQGLYYLNIKGDSFITTRPLIIIK